MDLGSREYRWPGYLLALLVAALALEALAYAYSLHKYPYAPPQGVRQRRQDTRVLALGVRALPTLRRSGRKPRLGIRLFQPGRYAGMTRR